MNYPIASFLTQIKNAYMARKKSIVFPHSKMIESIGNILVKEGYIKSLKVNEENGRKNIDVTLLYHAHTPSLKDVKIISKPSVHKYAKREEVKKSISRFNTSILSTNQGVMTAKEAAEKNLGGEILCKLN